MTSRPTIAVLGASGLIGGAIADDLARAGHGVRALARRFTRAQRAALGEGALESPFVSLDVARLAALLADVDIVVNCVGVLQGPAEAIHVGFVSRLLDALKAHERPVLLVHVSIPGASADDVTAFSRTKRAAERLIAGSGLPFLVLRPGFVVAPAAFGGSALMRALAALPVRLPHFLSARPMRATAIADICATVRRAAELWPGDWPAGGVVWDVMALQPSTVGEVLAAFRRRFGGPAPALTPAGWLLRLGAFAGDAAAWLGWAPPVRSTALAELRRGVDGDPAAWSAATAIAPASLDAALAACPVSVQEAWFGRLFLAKPLVIAGLAAFWIASGAVALGPGFDAAASFLAAHRVPAGWAGPVTWATALADIAIGAAIAVRRACRAGLLAGLALTAAYLAIATILAPALWADPLGPLVKTAPLILLMFVALAILPER